MREFDHLEEAKASFKKVLEINPKHPKAQINLGIIDYISGDIASSLMNMEKENSLDPKSKENRLFVKLLRGQKSQDEIDTINGNKNTRKSIPRLALDPLVLNRPVEHDLISALYEMKSKQLDKLRSADSRYGNGVCSVDSNVFDHDSSIIKCVAKDLTKIMMESINSEIFIYDSFFNILGAGGGTKPHTHLDTFDKDGAFNLQARKYSLVYYLCVEDQKCSQPSILHLFDPVKKILPCKGMIVITPATRRHYAVYGGKKDSIMIGVNFYAV